MQQAESITGGKSSIEPSQALDSVKAGKNPSGTWIACAIIVAVAGTMAWFTWGRWGDFQIDSGREIYVPAAILQGKLLYRDIWYMYGMLAPYAQALLFHFFGVSLTVLYVFGLALTIASALLIFEIARQFDLGLPVSVLPSLFFLSEAFYPFTFNFVFPYSYAASLATFLGLVCLYFVLRHAFGRRATQLGVAALFAALAILTKQEFGLACLLMLAFEVAASYLICRSALQLGQNLAICFAGLLPAMAGYGWFTWKLSAKLIYFDNWLSTPGTYFMRTFGKYTMARNGFRFVPQEMMSQVAVALLSLALWYGIAYANALAIKGRRQSRIILLTVALDILVITLLIFQVTKFSTLASFYVAQLTFPRGLFFLGLYFVIQALWKLCRSTKPGLALPDAVLGVYATLSSFRVLMDLYPSPYKYSVFFNVPLYLIFTILIARLVRWAGRSLDLRNRNALVNCLLCSAAVLYFVAILPDRRYLPTPVKTDIGTFYTKRDVAILLPQIISFMKTHTRNGRDILVIPDPPSFYVYAGMQSPTRWYSLVPGVVDPEHEQEFINEVTANDVRYILLSNRAFPECGVGTFGSGYNTVLYQWLTKNFRRVEKFGPLPIGFPNSYILNVYERKDIVPAL